MRPSASLQIVLVTALAWPGFFREAQAGELPAAAPKFDSALAKQVGADARGMRSYVLVILKTGPTPVAKGENRVISSHGNPFHAVAGPPYLAEGEIAVVRPEVRPDGAMRFSVIARIRPQDWPEVR